MAWVHMPGLKTGRQEISSKAKALCSYFLRQVRRSDETQVNHGQWQPYLHL